MPATPPCSRRPVSAMRRANVYATAVPAPVGAPVTDAAVLLGSDSHVSSSRSTTSSSCGPTGLGRVSTTLASTTGTESVEPEEDTDGLPLSDSPDGAGVDDGVGVPVGLARLEDESEFDRDGDAVLDADTPRVSALVGVPVGVRVGERVDERVDERDAAELGVIRL